MIPSYHSLLYATDLSENSAQALRHAVSLARAYDASIQILHVMPAYGPAMENDIAAAIGEDAFLQLEKGNQEALIEKIRQQVEDFAEEELQNHPEDRGRITGIEVRYGRPAATILERAELLDPDLIVCGTHGKGLLQHTLLGSVAEKVLRRSTRPVLIIPIR